MEYLKGQFSSSIRFSEGGGSITSDTDNDDIPSQSDAESTRSSKHNDQRPSSSINPGVQDFVKLDVGESEIDYRPGSEIDIDERSPNDDGEVGSPNDGKRKRRKDRKKRDGKDEKQRHRKDEKRRADATGSEVSFALNKFMGVMGLFVPITLCMIIVVFSIVAIPELSGPNPAREYYFGDQYNYGYSDSGSKKPEIPRLVIILLVMLGGIALLTTGLFLLYYYKFYKVILGYLMTSFTVIFTFIFGRYLERVFESFNVPVDYITLALFMFNFAVLGMMCIFWKGPLQLQQFFLVVMSALIALYFFEILPYYITWAFMGVMCVWDLVAVLCPYGPLRLLVETAQKRDEPILPALIYSSKMIWFERRGPSSANTALALLNQETGSGTDQFSTSADVPGFVDENLSRNRRASSATIVDKSNKGDDKKDEGVVVSGPVAVSQAALKTPTIVVSPSPSDAGSHHASPEQPRQSRRPTQRPSTKADAKAAGSSKDFATSFVHQDDHKPLNDDEEEEDDDGGIKLGLGDFIFYSLLVGTAAQNKDWTAILSCYLAILEGLCATLVILAIYRQPLPALPISITLGIIFNFSAVYIITPFMLELNLKQIFI